MPVVYRLEKFQNRLKRTKSCFKHAVIALTAICTITANLQVAFDLINVMKSSQCTNMGCVLNVILFLVLQYAYNWDILYYFIIKVCPEL